MDLVPKRVEFPSSIIQFSSLIPEFKVDRNTPTNIAPERVDFPPSIPP